MSVIAIRTGREASSVVNDYTVALGLRIKICFTVEKDAEGFMATELNFTLAAFIGNNGRIFVLCREMGIRKSITGITTELGLGPLVQVVAEDFREPKAQKNFISSLLNVRQLLLVMDFNNENSPSYFHLLDTLYEQYRERLRVVAIVDKAYQGLISLLYARGARAVLIKPFMPRDLGTRIMSVFAEPSVLERLIDIGRECLDKGESARALAICRKIESEYEHTHQSLLFCGDVQLALGEYRKAGRYFMLGFRDEQLSFQAYARLAKLCAATGRRRGEIFWLTKFAQINTLDYTNYIRIGELFLAQNRESEAREYFTRSINAARKITSEERTSGLIFDIAGVCVDNASVDMSREYSTQLLRYGNVDKTLLSEVAFFRMNRLNDPDGACSIYSLLAVREEKRGAKMDVHFWSTALYNAAVCHHTAYGDQRMIRQKNRSKRASDYILDIFSLNPDFGRDDPNVTANIAAIAANPLQQNIQLTTLLARLGRM
jgi:tetratricopeptide (TPR) repeat protein